MLKSDDPHLTPKVIDEQLVLIPNEQGWEILKVDPFIDGIELLSEGTRYLLWKDIEFAQKYSEFTVALFKPSEIFNKWMPLVLLHTQLGYQRVHLERLMCNECGWQGQTANPLISDLYLGVPNSWKALKETEKYPLLPCPRCKSKLPRYPIWVEPNIKE